MVWGAGIAGLLLAYFLQKNNIDVTVQEIGDAPGGKIKSFNISGHIIENAANAVYLNQDVFELLEELNLLDKILIPSKQLKRFIYRSGKVVSIFSQIPIFKMLKNLFLTTPSFRLDLSVFDFFEPWIGEAGITNLIDPALSGIYATPSSEVLFSSVFPHFFPDEHLLIHNTYPKNYRQFVTQLLALKRHKKKLPISGSISFVGGMSSLVQKLATKLAGKIIYHSQERPNFERDNNIICTDVFAAQAMLANFSEWQAALAKIKYTAIASNTLLLKKEIASLRHAFGILFNAKNSKVQAMGVLANHHIFPKNFSQLFSYTVISKNSYQDLDQIVKELSLLATPLTAQDVQYHHSAYWLQGLPVYDDNRYEAITRLHELARTQTGVCLFGNYVAGISIREMISAAKNFARNAIP